MNRSINEWQFSHLWQGDGWWWWWTGAPEEEGLQYRAVFIVEIPPSIDLPMTVLGILTDSLPLQRQQRFHRSPHFSKPCPIQKKKSVYSSGWNHTVISGRIQVSDMRPLSSARTDLIAGTGRDEWVVWNRPNSTVQRFLYWSVLYLMYSTVHVFLLI